MRPQNDCPLSGVRHRMKYARMKFAAPLSALLLLTACRHAIAPPDFADGTPVMRPETFFAGPTVSTGVLEDRGGAPIDRFTVRGEGHVLPNGDFQLTQDIAFEHDAPTHRAWTVHRTDAHHYTATLDGARGPHGRGPQGRGPVALEAWGNLLHISYPMASPPLATMEQWLYLQPDGVTAVNEATVRILGIVVARLSERITHVGPGPVSP